MVRQTKSCSQWTSPDCSKRNADEKILSKKIRTDVARFGRLQIRIVMMTVKGKLVKVARDWRRQCKLYALRRATNGYAGRRAMIINRHGQRTSLVHVVWEQKKTIPDRHHSWEGCYAWLLCINIIYGCRSVQHITITSLAYVLTSTGQCDNDKWLIRV